MHKKSNLAMRCFQGLNSAVGIIAMSLFGTAISGRAADPAEAEQRSAALHERLEAYQQAWNEHDPNAVAAFFAEDADFVMGNLPPRRGRDEIREWWRDYFARQEPYRGLTLNVNSLRFLTPDIALINILTTTAGQDSLGKEIPARRFRGTWVMHRMDGEWLIVALLGLPTEEDRVELTPSMKAAESLRPQLRALVAAYEDTFNRHDPEALSAFYRSDADIIVREGRTIHGAQAIRASWNAYFSQPRPYRALFIVDEIKTLSDNVALLEITATGAVSHAPSKLQPVRHARARWVVVRENGDWLIAALRVLPSEDDRIVRGHEQSH